MKKKSAMWVFEEGIRPYSMFEPLHFERMRGLCPDNRKQVYDFMRTPAFMRHLAAQGYNQVWVNWWKGYGLNHERECQDQIARLIPVCKELGVRVVCYHSFGSLTLDTLLPEEPDAVNWITRTQAGQPTSCQVTYQTFRRRPCFSSEGYLAYMEKVLARAIDAGADGIHFDNIGMQAEPESCHCERCTGLFRDYLQKNYGGKLGEEIFGMSDFSQATVPWFNQHNQANGLWRASAPHHWAWIDFKCHTYSKAARRLTDFIHNRNPNVYVEMNAAEADGFAPAFWRANDAEQVYEKLELVCDESSPRIGLNARGAIVGQYRAKKLSRAMGCAHWGHGDGDPSNFCEDLALNGAPNDFWAKYKHYQLRSESTARIAVLREHYSMAYNRWDPREETLAMEQYLIERRLPFDFVFNSQLDGVAGRYDLLIVSGAEVMPDSVRDALVKYVKGGGALLLSGAVGVYDRYYRVRCQPMDKIETVEDMEAAGKPFNALHELIGTDPRGSGEAALQRSVGKGKVAWIRGMDIEKTPHTPAYWTIPTDAIMMPRNASDIDRLLAWLVPGGLGLQVEGHGRLYVHQARRTDTGEILVHLINHEFATRTARADIRVHVTKAPQEVVSISVDDGDANYPERKESFGMSGSTLIIPVEDIRTHRTVIIR